MEAVFEDGDEGRGVAVCGEEIIVAVAGGGFCFEEEDRRLRGHFGVHVRGVCRTVGDVVGRLEGR